MKKPEEFHIVDKEDIYFFYDLVMNQGSKSIKNRKSISSISSKYGIEIKIEKAGTSKSIQPVKDSITIFDEDKSLNERFFSHLRNAFAHCYIEISENRCKFIDWNAYIENKKCKFGKNRITLLGDVNYDDFKKMMDEFFSDTSLKKQKANKNDKTD